MHTPRRNADFFEGQNAACRDPDAFEAFDR